MTARTNRRPRMVLRAKRAMEQAPDTRAIKRELERDNHYVSAMLRRRGVVYVRELGLLRRNDEPRFTARYRDGYYVVIDTASGQVVPPGAMGTDPGHYQRYEDGYLWDYAAGYVARDLNERGATE